MGTPHQYTVGRLLKKIAQLKRSKKISNKSVIEVSDAAGIERGKFDGVFAHTKEELSFSFRVTHFNGEEE